VFLQDEMLLAAIDQADSLIADEIQKLKKRRYLYTAKHLSELKPSTNYSAKACKKRYRALVSDKAKIPPELDDNPHQRAEEKANRILKFLERQAVDRTAQLDAVERAKKDEEEQKLELYEKQLQTAKRKEKEEKDKHQRFQDRLTKKERQALERIHKTGQRMAKIEDLKKRQEKRLADFEEKRQAEAKMSAEEAARARQEHLENRRAAAEKIARDAAARRALTGKPGTRARARHGRGGKAAVQGRAPVSARTGTPKAYKSSEYVNASDDESPEAGTPASASLIHQNDGNDTDPAEDAQNDESMIDD
jgi:hypothetical protein